MSKTCCICISNLKPILLAHSLSGRKKNKFLKHLQSCSTFRHRINPNIDFLKPRLDGPTSASRNKAAKWHCLNNLLQCFKLPWSLSCFSSSDNLIHCWLSSINSSDELIDSTTALIWWLPHSTSATALVRIRNYFLYCSIIEPMQKCAKPFFS